MPLLFHLSTEGATLIHRRGWLPTLLLVAVGFSGLVGSPVLADDAGHHTVQAGDTLYSLAKHYGTTVNALVQSNGIGADFKIRIGQVLMIPQSGGVAATTSTLPAGKVAIVQPTTLKESVKATNTPDHVATVLAVSEEGREFTASGSPNTIGRPVKATPSPTSSTPAPVPPAKVNAPPEAVVRAVVPDPAPATPPVATADVTGTTSAAVQSTGEQGWVIPVADGEMDLLAGLVAAEAGNEPLDGQVGVAAVVINRVKHPAFPKTISEVINEPGQFKSVELGRVNGLGVSSTTLTAVRQALAGTDPTGGALFFYNPAKSTALAFWSTRPVTAVIGNHTFAR